MTTATDVKPYRDTARDVLAATDTSDVFELAARVFDAWTPEQRTEAARAFATALVPQLWSMERREVAAGHRVTPSTSTARSWRVDGIRDHAARVRAMTVHVGPHVFRTLDACTEADLGFAAQERRDNAARNAYRAEQYETLRKALADAGAVTVADLPDAVVAAMFTTTEDADA